MLLTGWLNQMVKRRNASSISRDSIIEVAAEEFAEKGFAGARVDEIARRAGVNKALLYYHVGNKQQLYTAVVERVIDGASVNLGRVFDAVHDPIERVRAMTSAIASFAAANPQLPAIMLREFASGGRNLEDGVLLRVAQLLQKVGSIYRDGAERQIFRQVDPVTTHMMTVSSLMLLVGARPLRARLAHTAGLGSYTEPAVGELAAAFADVLLDGIRLHKEPPR
jgi:TetR/AcrR family transcriptional regulator